MEKYLRKCLDSLVVSEENRRILEVLVINDGSKDSSSQIGYEYESKYPLTFRVIDKDNGNYGSCVNRGLKEAKGKYVKILDADDFFSIESLEHHLFFLSSTDVDMILSDYVIVDETGSVKKRVSFPLASDCNYSFEDICAKDGVADIQMHAVTYKLEILREMNYHQTEGISYTDQEWIFLPMTKVRTMSYQPIVLYNYLVGRTGQTMQASVLNRSFSQQVTCAVNRLEALKNSNLDLTENLKYYLFHSLGRVVCYVYRATIMRGLYSIDELYEFDCKIKSLNPEFYQLISKEHINFIIFDYYYINCFRRKKETAPFLLRFLYLMLYKIFHE